jgi:hypothetical protein
MVKIPCNNSIVFTSVVSHTGPVWPYSIKPTTAVATPAVAADILLYHTSTYASYDKQSLRSTMPVLHNIILHFTCVHE